MNCTRCGEPVKVHYSKTKEGHIMSRWKCICGNANFPSRGSLGKAIEE